MAVFSSSPWTGRAIHTRPKAVPGRVFRCGAPGPGDGSICVASARPDPWAKTGGGAGSASARVRAVPESVDVAA